METKVAFSGVKKLFNGRKVSRSAAENFAQKMADHDGGAVTPVVMDTGYTWEVGIAHKF